MDDIVTGASRGWTLDPTARHAMLLDASRTAAAQGDHAAAVVLAEELLDEQPDDIDALLIVAGSAPDYGHGEVGALAASQAARRGAEVGSLEASALLSACQVERALAAVEASLARQPDEARSYFVRGLALELTGRGEEAQADFARAASLDPLAFPPPLLLPLDAWDPLVFAATSALDAPIRDALRGVTIEVVELPSLEVLLGLQPPPSPLVDALLLDPDARRPCLQIYRGNVLRGATSPDDVTERLRRALLAEAELLLRDED